MKSQKIILIFSGIFLLVYSAYTQLWLTTQRLTWDTINSESPVISLGSGNDVHVAWYGDLISHSEIYYKKSSDMGTTWSTPKRLTWSNRCFGNVDICVDGSNRVFVAFPDLLYGISDVFYKKSGDGGLTWQPLKRLTWTAGHSNKVSMAYDFFSNIYIVWNDSTPGNYEIYLKKSTDAGTTWMAPKRLSWTTNDSYFPILKTSSITALHVAWIDGNQILYKSSNDGGSVWSPLRKVTWSGNNPRSLQMTIDSNGDIYLIWYDDSETNTEIFLKKSNDGGNTWSALQRLTWNSGHSGIPAIGTSSTNTIHIAWHDKTPGNYEIFYKKSTDGGTNWLANNRVTWNATDSVCPGIAIAPSNQVHLTWEDNLSPDSEIFYKKSQLIVIKDKD